VAKLEGVFDEVIEEARQRVGVAPDWDVDWCLADCGQFVFYPPGAREAAQQQGTPFVIVCSGECLEQILKTRRFRQ
jgi:hypothetical protein